MSLRALMVDVDGVVARRPDGRRWDGAMRRDLGLDPERLQTAFFATHFGEIVLGRADLYERLRPVLTEIAPQVACEDLVAYWFEQDGHLDHALLEDLAVLRADGLELHLATVQEHHRARHLWETLGLKSRFEAMHYAAALGCKKPETAFYRAVEARTGFAPHELALLDDSPRNVEAARACGWGAALWTAERPLAEVLAEAGLRP